MAIERRWESVGPIAFTQDGGSDGTVTVGNLSGFKVKQKAVLVSDTQDNLVVEVKRVLSPTKMIVGRLRDDKSRKIDNPNDKLDISAYTVADNATVRAEGQPKKGPSDRDIWTAVYEQEPTVALRTIAVDEFGDFFNEENPMPTANNVKDKYSVQEIAEQGQTTYIGKETTRGKWLIERFVETGNNTAVRYANVSNNPTRVTFTDAWTNRASLTYDLIENLTEL